MENFLEILFTPISTIDRGLEVSSHVSSTLSHWIWLSIFSTLTLGAFFVLRAVTAFLIYWGLVKLTNKIHNRADIQSNLSQMRNNVVAARRYYRIAGWFHQKSGMTTGYTPFSTPATAAPWMQKTSVKKSKYSIKLISWLWRFASNILDLKGGLLTIFKSPYSWYICLGSLWVVQRNMANKTFSSLDTISITTLATMLTVLTFVFTFFFTVSRRARTQFLTEKLKQAENSLHAIGHYADEAHYELEEFTNAIYRKLPSLSYQLVREATKGKFYIRDGVIHSSPSPIRPPIPSFSGWETSSLDHRKTEYLNDVFSDYPKLNEVIQSLKKIEKELEEDSNFKFLARQCPPPAWSLVQTARRESRRSRITTGASASGSSIEHVPGRWSALQNVSKDALLLKYEETKSQMQDIWAKEPSDESITKIQRRLNQWLEMLRKEIQDLCELEVELRECARSINEATTSRGFLGLLHSFSR